LDLEESLGTVDTTRAAYNRMLDLRIATPQLLLNFAAYLEENKYFEEAFTVYERGVAAFKWPHVKPIWHRYIDKFIERYGGSKLERARELFEQATSKVPKDHAADLYLKFAKLEEEHGLVRHAMAIYDRATKVSTQTH
jgi:pre-mRNA-splicing factor SYF1